MHALGSYRAECSGVMAHDGGGSGARVMSLFVGGVHASTHVIALTQARKVEKY